MAASKGTNLSLNHEIKAAVERELKCDLLNRGISNLANELFLQWLKDERGIDLVASKKSLPPASMGLTLAVA